MFMSYLEKLKASASKAVKKSSYSTKFNALDESAQKSFIHALVGINDFLNISYELDQEFDDVFFELVFPNMTDDLFKSISGNNVINDNYIDGFLFLDSYGNLVSGDDLSDIGQVIFYQSKSGKSGHFANDARDLLQTLEFLDGERYKLVENDPLKKVYSLLDSYKNIKYIPLYISLDSDVKIDDSIHAMVDPFVDALNKKEGFDFDYHNFLFTKSSLNELHIKQTVSSEIRISELTEHTYANSKVHAYIGFSHMYNYLDFLNRKDSLADFSLDKGLFLKNIRSNIGNNSVNKSIYDTFLKGPGSFKGDIWWLSNGITIVAKDIYIQGDTVKLEQPSIVNGQQTSRQLANAFYGEKDEFEKNNPEYSPWKFMIKIFIGDYDAKNMDDLMYQIVVGLNSQSAVNKNSVDLVYPETLELQAMFSQKNKKVILEIKRGEYSQNEAYTKRNTKNNILYIEELIQYAASANFVNDENGEPISIGKIRSSKSTIVRKYHKEIFKNQNIKPEDLYDLAYSIQQFKKNLEFTEEETLSGMKYLTFAIFRLIFMDQTMKKYIDSIDSSMKDKFEKDNINKIKQKLKEEIEKYPGINWDQESKKDSFQKKLDNIYPRIEILKPKSSENV